MLYFFRRTSTTIIFATEPLQKKMMFSLSHLVQVDLKLYKIEIAAPEIDENMQALKSDPTKKYVDKKRIFCCMS